MIVVDASAVVALLTDSGGWGEFVGSLYARHEIAYPSLMPYEVASALRRLAASRKVDEPLAFRSLRSVTAVHGQVFEFEELGDRIWQLRSNISVYDAAYVALAELLDVPLLTLDARLQAAPGPRCRFVELHTSP